MCKHSLQDMIQKMSLDEVMMYEIIINPGSKCGKGREVWEQVQSYMDQHGIVYHVNTSRKMGVRQSAV